ncbi:hypothetical protein [Jannaschia donghaensis]|uniref:Porin domain-containing protein n=1 Tax=Jannaschia donghaensis TaxID=420998 RepID=A0A0M6YGI9_9RHOB|nr:hypothetical protein [Jannaschia donghaensis]CTQ49070.1 hypothetical protein JDO7802_01080 [Jannaschia donghaensis]
MRFLAAVLLCLLPTLAGAGPWVRDKGQIYALLSHGGGGDGWTGLYVEYGGPRRLTFGLDAGGHVVGLSELARTGFTDRDVDGRVRSFVRIPVPLPGGPAAAGVFAPWLAAVELSLGRDFNSDENGDGMVDTVDRFGIGGTVGHGFSTRFGDGWTTLDIAASFPSKGETRTSLGLVVGIKPFDRVAVDIALYAEREDDTDYSVGPTVQYDFGTVASGRLGVAYTSDGDIDVTVGISRSF